MATIVDMIRSEPALILSGVAGAVACLWLWLWLSAGNKVSMPSNPPKAARRSLTFRISNIPRAVTKDEFRDILTKLAITTENISDQSTLLEFSYVPSATKNLSERYVVATATFAKAPTLSELEKAIRREIGAGASRLKVDLDFLGLTPLVDPLQDAVVDIIAVTGLAGHAFGSWKSKNNPDMWLRDFLPESIPNARILTYGYDTKLPGSQSEASILELSKRLLESIKTIRYEQMRTRPLILIGHSLGGLVVKEALVEVSEGSEDDQAVFRSCYAILFFAVPNRGLDNRSLMSMVKGQPNEDLVKSLGKKSRFSSLLHQRFYKCFTYEDTKIICVFETKETPTVEWCPETGSWERTGPKVMMVPHTSAIHAGPNEKSHDQLSINADHSEIVKFSNPSDPDYLIIESRMRELVANAPGVIKERFSSLKRKLSRLEIQYIEALKAPNYAAFRSYKVDNPTPGTLSWFLKNELLHTWLTTDESSVLWVKGSPGQGKTILAKFLLAHLEHLSSSSDPYSNRHTTVIYFFFYDQDDNYRTVGGALRSLIKQLLSVQDSFQIISDKFDIESPTITDESAWDILRELLYSPIFGTIYCVIDALDECQDHELRHRLLELIKTLVQPPLARRRQKLPILKAFLTSRPTVDLTRSLEQFPSIHLKASSDDLKIFVQSKIYAIKLTTELEDMVINLLSSRVEQTFLWISIVLKKLAAATTLLSQAHVEQIINETPSDLADLYESIISQIMQGNDIAAQKLLIWTVFGRRALTLNELEEALAIQDDSKSKESIRKYKISLTENAITSAVGIILEIINGRIYLIHQSAKDFLLKSGHLAKAEFCKGLRPGIYLAKICMTYLCFTDFETGACQDNTLREERYRHYPFFHYAARNWHRYIGIEDDINAFTTTICQLTLPYSPRLLAWGEAAGIANLDKARDTLDIAMTADIPWLAEFQSRDNMVTEEMIEKAAGSGMAGYNYLETLIRKGDTSFTEGAVCVAAKHFDRGMIRLMLDRDTSIHITPAVIRAAVTNEKSGKLIMGLLLERESQFSFMVTADLVRLAAENHENGRDIIELILRNANTNISEDAVAEIAANFSVESMILLLNSREDINITEMVILATRRKNRDADKMITLLLEQRGQDMPITEEFVNTLTRYLDKEVMMLLLEKRGQDMPITEEIVNTITGWFNKKVILLLLKKRCQDMPISEEIVNNIARCYEEEVMMLLLKKRGQDMPITEEIVNTIARRFNKEVMLLLLEKRGQDMPILEEIVNIISRWHDEEVMMLLLKKRGQDMPITEEIVNTIARRFDKEVMLLLLEKRGQDVQITEGVVKAAAGNNAEVLALLLDRGGDQITITEEVLKAAVDNWENGKEIITLLLDRRGYQITIIEEVVKAAAGNDAEVLALLLDRRGDQITITEEVVKAAAGNNAEVLALLLDRRGYQITITEEVVKAAAGNWRNGKEIKLLLLDRRGDQTAII
ncbi:hypothetical protein V8C37DRAFT_387023 [Trichoderma ceciliae]